MRIWFLTQRLPYAPNRGDRIRAYHILRFLRRHADVDVFSLVHDDDERARVGDLDGLASSVVTADVPKWRNRLRALASLPGSRPLTLSLLDAPALDRELRSAFEHRRPDVVLAYCSSMARFALQPPLSTVPMVLDMVDVDSEKWRALGQTAPLPQRLVFRREARCLRAFEHQAMSAAAVTTAVNEREVAALRAIHPQAKTALVQNGIDLETFSPTAPPQPSTSVVFCGVLDYAPNEDACIRLAVDIWPQVLAARPDARLLLVGAKPTAKVLALAKLHSSIDVTGAVPDVRPYLWQSAVAAVPLRTARGVQNKVLEALAAGLPTLVSSVVSEGLPRVALRGTRTTDSDAEFANGIVELLGLTPAARSALAASSDLTSLSWPHQLAPLWDAIQTTADGH